MNGWIGVDLDGTLARYDGWVSPERIGEPIHAMAERVREWLAAGIEVRIFTARVSPGNPERGTSIDAIKKWTFANFGVVIPATATKDFGMVELWDDRCVQVIPNTGRRADGK